ncbi:hypothetical protein ACK9U2_002274 [Pseudomonas putida]
MDIDQHGVLLVVLASAANHRWADDWLELRSELLAININTFLISVYLFGNGKWNFKDVKTTRWQKWANKKQAGGAQGNVHSVDTPPSGK